MIKNFLQELRTQRWDDHRYYHHSRINPSLHFVSAASFLFAYAMLFIDPMVSALVGWLVSMTSRQAGHFFFEPRGYDHVNQATHEHKEEIKVGYNLQRKVVLMAIWALSPLVLYFDPTLFGLFTPWTSPAAAAPICDRSSTMHSCPRIRPTASSTSPTAPARALRTHPACPCSGC